MSVLIKGGRVVTAVDDTVADVFVDGERISLIGESLDLAADRVIDAAGKLVLPGGIDPHTHLDMPFGGTRIVDDFFSGHRRRGLGGDDDAHRLLHPTPGTSFAKRWLCGAGARGQGAVDNGFHIAITDLTDGGALEELPRCPSGGSRQLKLFMAYKGALMVDDETLFGTMEGAAKTCLVWSMPRTATRSTCS